MRLAIAWVSLLVATAAHAATIIVVRHADRDQSAMTTDVPLNARGQQRAEALARTLADAGVRYIYTTEVKRTQQTAQPLAGRIHVRIQVVPGADVQKLAGILKLLRPDDVALVVGHSDTIPAIVSALGGSTPPLGETEFDRMLIVHTDPAARTTVLTLHYGN